MRPSGTLQSPTTGSLEAMLREADHEDQVAEFRLKQKNAGAVVAQAPPATLSPGVFPASASINAPGAAVAQTPTAPATNGTAATKLAMNPGSQPATAGGQQLNKTQNAAEEMPAFVPAPKSLVSNSAATEVAAVNTNLNSDARATLTSLSAKPIDAAVSPISVKGRGAQLTLGPVDQTMKIGESRRFALDVKSDVPLSLAILALRFDPKVVKVRAVGVDGSGANVTQSTDASGVCVISIANLSGMTGPGTLIYIDVEGVGLGDAGLQLDQTSTHLVATDARNLGVDVTPARATVKQ